MILSTVSGTNNNYLSKIRYNKTSHATKTGSRRLKLSHSYVNVKKEMAHVLT